MMVSGKLGCGDIGGSGRMESGVMDLDEGEVSPVLDNNKGTDGAGTAAAGGKLILDVLGLEDLHNGKTSLRSMSSRHSGVPGKGILGSLA